MRPFVLCCALMTFGAVERPLTASEDTRATRPIVLTTTADLDTARQRIEQRIEPLYSTWLKTLAQADDSLPRPPDPYQGTDHEEYFRVGTRQGIQARSLALVFRLEGERQYADKARELLLAWANERRQYPFNLSEPSHSAGLVIARVVVVFADAYALLYDKFDASEREQIDRWLRSLADAIQVSRRIWVHGQLPGRPTPYLGRQNFNNHLGAHTMGLAAIGYALADDALIRYALRDPANPRNLKTLIDGAIVSSRRDLYHGDPTLTQGAPNPQRGEVYDRYRTTEGKGLGYCHIHLRFLTLTALMARNNGDSFDYFAYSGNGAGLEAAFNFYSDFLLSGNTAARTGYYREDHGVDFGLLGVFEVASRIYRDNDLIRMVLCARQRVRFDSETFGWTAPLVHGADDVPLRTAQWEFDRDGHPEGWSLRKSLTGTARSGLLELHVTGTDPGLLSPAELDVDATAFRTIRVRMRNETSDKQGTVFFTTNLHPSFEGTHVFFDLIPNDSEIREYDIDVARHDAWKGVVKQIRLDPVHSATSGRVFIDSVHIAP